MTNFEKWNREFGAQNLYAFNNDEDGLLWLKVRAVCRNKQLQQFCEDNGITLSSKGISARSVELFEQLERTPDAMLRLDNFLKIKGHEWYDALGVDESKLKEDLYKVQHYAWGGDRNNSLDKYLVSRYVKTISNYDELVCRQPEIAQNSWNYVQTSWYNNWTSYLMESLFKKHKKVVSAVGEIKSVDFFLAGYPIDLKTTFFPRQYMDEKLTSKLGKKELSWLKGKARKLGISADSAQSEQQQIYTLSEKLSEKGNTEILSELRENRGDVVAETQKNPLELMRWLYENQGEMRFGAENRLFVVLADTTDMEQSWKMKRAFSVIEPQVNDYLDNFSVNSLKPIDFTFKGNAYHSLADVIFIIKR